MFGQNDTSAQQPTNQVPDDALSASLTDPLNNTNLGNGTPPVDNGPGMPPPPANNPVDNGPSDLQGPTFDQPATDSPAMPDPLNNPAPTPPPPPAGDLPSADDLLDMKQQALQQLSPLVGQLDQSPEEKFRTTMMMIQASDDQSLLPTAYQAANQISDEKVRAQALLDVVNEINYFTQHKNNQ